MTSLNPAGQLPPTARKDYRIACVAAKEFRSPYGAAKLAGNTPPSANDLNP